MLVLGDLTEDNCRFTLGQTLKKNLPDKNLDIWIFCKTLDHIQSEG